MTTQREPFYHSHSYTGNPLACAVSVASFQLLLSEPERYQSLETRHWQCQQQYLADLNNLKQFRTCGTIAAMELETEASYFSELVPQLRRRFIELGVLLRPLGNTVYILPPYCVTDGGISHRLSSHPSSGNRGCRRLFHGSFCLSGHVAQQPVDSSGTAGTAGGQFLDFIARKAQLFLEQLFVGRRNRACQFDNGGAATNEVRRLGIVLLPFWGHAIALPSLSIGVIAITQAVPQKLIYRRIIQFIIENLPQRGFCERGELQIRTAHCLAVHRDNYNYLIILES